MEQKRIFLPYLWAYLSKEILASFFIGTAIFLLIMLTFQVIRLTEFVIVHQVPFLDVMEMAGSLVLTFMPLAVPVAFLFAVLMGVSRANSEGELIALQVSGYHKTKIFFPLAVFASGLSVFCLLASLYWVPRGNRNFELLVTRLGSERIMTAIKPGVFVEGFFGLVLLAEHIVPIKNELKRVFIYDAREPNRPLAITAQAGLLKTETEKSVVSLRLTNGSIFVEKPKNLEVQQRIDFDVYDIRFPVGQKPDAWRAYSLPSLIFPQLLQRLKEIKPDPIQYRQLQVELHRRFSLAFSCFVFAALGFFVGALNQRGVRSTAIISCLLVGLIYWLGYLAANAVAVKGWGAPWIVMWLPNVIFLGVAYGCYKYSQTH